jgi:bifunctional DNA-binding transcriptional regulator/antitoxin component of YhaV-PrlF toxin-antitoxin module
MSAHTKVEASGGILLPPGVSTLQGWSPGTELEVQNTPGAVVLRPLGAAPASVPIDWEAFRRGLPKHEGPPATLEEMERAIDQGRAERWARKEHDSQ